METVVRIVLWAGPRQGVAMPSKTEKRCPECESNQVDPIGTCWLLPGATDCYVCKDCRTAFGQQPVSIRDYGPESPQNGIKEISDAK